MATASTFSGEQTAGYQGSRDDTAAKLNMPEARGTAVPLEHGDPDRQAAIPPELLQKLGPNYEYLEQHMPEVVQTLRQLVLDFRMEGIVGRRHEIRKIKQARLFWQGIQYLTGWLDDDQMWRLPFGGSAAPGLSVVDEEEEAINESRYKFVTNFYQAFGLSFIAVCSQDVPTIHWYPQSAQNEQDIATAKAASDASDLVQENNHTEDLLAAIAWFLWCDGVVCSYTRYITDGQRFGTHDSPQMELQEQKLGPDVFHCDWCGQDTPAQGGSTPASLTGTTLMSCPNCGRGMSQANFQPGQTAQVPMVTSVKKVPNGQEVISIYGGLEVVRPIYSDDPVNDGAFMQLQLEVHEAKLRAAYPHVADKIKPGTPNDAEDVYARASRVSVKQGLPTTHPGDALVSLPTFSRTWMEPWVFYSERVPKEMRPKVLQLFPDGAYIAFAGDTYCESRNENKKDHWRVLQPMPGDGQNRPAVGHSLVSVQERYNILSNTLQENAEFGIPPTYADPQVMDFDAINGQTAEPGAFYPTRGRVPGQPIANAFFQPEAGKLPPEIVKMMDDMFAAIAQFLTGLFPAVFGGAMQGSKTAEEYSMARDQALGRLGLYWRGVKSFWAQTMQLAVECFRKNRPEDVEVPILGEDGDFESKVIRLADLRGNLQARPEADETFPRLKSQQKTIWMNLLTQGESNPVLGQILSEPANMAMLKQGIGVKDLVIPGEDSRNKQLREISLLLKGAPVPTVDPQSGQTVMKSTIPIRKRDRHAIELQEGIRWENSQAGQDALKKNPMGFANVDAHLDEHEEFLAAQQQQAANKPPSESMNFKDMPPEGKVQMAKQAGIELSPAGVVADEEQDRQDKKDELRVKLAGLRQKVSGKSPQDKAAS